LPGVVTSLYVAAVAEHPCKKAVIVLTAKADDAVKLRLRHARLNSFVEFPGDGCPRLQKAHAEQRKRNAEAARDRKDDRGTLRLKDIHAALVSGSEEAEHTAHLPRPVYATLPGDAIEAAVRGSEGFGRATQHMP